MNCLKCGKEAAENQVFCSDCLAVMQNYPIKPGTAIYLPHRDAPLQEKKHPDHRRALTPDAQMAQLRSMIRWLTATIAVLSVLLCLTAAMLIHTLDKQTTPSAIGKNYTTVEPESKP